MPGSTAAEALGLARADSSSLLSNCESGNGSGSVVPSLPELAHVRDEIAIVRSFAKQAALKIALLRALTRDQAALREIAGSEPGQVIAVLDTSSVDTAALDSLLAAAASSSLASSSSFVAQHDLGVVRTTALAIRSMRKALIEGRFADAKQTAEQLAQQYDEGAGVASTATSAVALAGVSTASLPIDPALTLFGAGREMMPAPSDQPLLAPQAEAEVRAVAKGLQLLEQRQATVAAVVAALRADHGPERAETLQKSVAALRLSGADRDPHCRGGSEVAHAATEVLQHLLHARDLCEQALTERDLSSLEAAVAAAEEATYTGPQALEARLLRDALRDISQKSLQALQDADAAAVSSLMARAQEMRLIVPYASEMQHLLALPKPQLLQAQLRAAVTSNNIEAVAAATLAIKTLFFEESHVSFPLSACPKLQPFADFEREVESSNSSGGATYRVMRDLASMATSGKSYAPDAVLVPWLTFSSAPLPAPLTVLPPALRPAALAINRTILGFCGDAPFDRPLLLAAQLVQVANLHVALRDEIYLQLMRHLSRGSSIASAGSGTQRDLLTLSLSEQRGWQLLYLCLRSFPPSEELENTLEWMVRTRLDAVPNEVSDKASVFLLALHRTAYLSQTSALPTASYARGSAVSSAVSERDVSAILAQAPI
jgi:hypothetical protein